MSRRRTVAVGVLFAAAGLALTACQPSTGTAAYVGDRRITDQDLQDEVDVGLGQASVKQQIEQQDGGLAAYKRTVLFREVRHELVERAADQGHVTVDQAAVDQLVAAQGGYEQIAASSGLTREQAESQARDYLTVSELGYAGGTVQKPSDASLMKTYEDQKAGLSKATLQLVQVPDEATLNKGLTDAKADPTAFDKLVAQYPDTAQADPTEFAVGTDLPTDLQPEVAEAAPNSFVAFVGQSQDGSGQYVLIKVIKVTTPTFDSVKLTLSAQNLSAAYSAGQAVLAKLATEVSVRVNPRYGTWNTKTLQVDETSNPVLTLTEPTPTATEPSTGIVGGTSP